MSFVSFSRLSTSRTRRSSSQSTTSPWTWWRSPTLKRPSRWSVIRTTSSPCISTPRCLMTWRCRRPREHTLCRARWDRQLLSRFVMPLLMKKQAIFYKKVCVCLLQNVYRSDLNYLRGAAWIATGALQIEGSKRATDLISDVGHCFIPFSICWVYIQQFFAGIAYMEDKILTIPNSSM